MAPELVLGPLLRYAGEREATVWVETDVACEVEVLGHRARTFEIEGHRYALVRITDLEPGETYEYEVALEGERVWPEEGSDLPPSVIRTIEPDGELNLSFGSCRISVPHEPPYTHDADAEDAGYERDALYALALRMMREPHESWPDALLLLGDQVYADEVSRGTLEFIRSRRDPEEPPGETVADFEEYTRLYYDAWKNPVIRWLLSTVPSTMIFDDHDVHDDWNISKDWLDQMRTGPMWDEHIIGALMAYWIYQHIGNLSPSELAKDELFHRVHEVDDAVPILRQFAKRADREPDGTRWSFCRDLGDTRLVVIDSRAGRVLDPGARSMLDEDEWRWLEETATGGFDHLLLATSVPWLLMPAMHDLEAWNEAVCDGAWGGLAERLAENVRQAIDLEHWPAFRESFARLGELQRAVGAGERGEPPASILTLSGDVHHAYLNEVAFRNGSGVQSAVYQAVCSPFRNPLDDRERTVIRSALSGPMKLFARAMARAAGVGKPEVRWRQLGDGPWFDNQFATLLIDGRSMLMRLDKVVGDEENETTIVPVLERQLA
ncbi:MAG: alkaline phosphatase family protein [Actinomycetota bacterium]|nr:alkaline phosphatase family protein [Actinomycetota bacterium]